ncbi:MAG: hypothetical protein J07HR59_00213 [Halorubrum sp. J07HR59]|nr:MAG: hypothetical protein J07HR59_00213 [Halorubrum sp. J07HR59]
MVCPFTDSKTELKITLDSMTPGQVGCVDETVNYNGPLTVPDWWACLTGPERNCFPPLPNRTKEYIGYARQVLMTGLVGHLGEDLALCGAQVL